MEITFVKNDKKAKMVNLTLFSVKPLKCHGMKIKPGECLASWGLISKPNLCSVNLPPNTNPVLLLSM